MSIDYVSNWQKRLRGRLYRQFKTMPNIIAISDMIAAQVQDFEDAAQATLTLTSIDDSVGPQLELLGRVIGQGRLGASDAVYRQYLKARVLANRSNGTTENLYDVFNALLGALGFIITTHPTKTFVMKVNTVITSAQAQIAALFMRSAKESGARGLLYWTEDVAANLFTFDTGPGFEAGKFAGQVDV